MAKQAVNKYTMGQIVFFIKDKAVTSAMISCIIFTGDTYIYGFGKYIENTTMTFSFINLIAEKDVFANKDDLIKSL